MQYMIIPIAVVHFLKNHNVVCVRVSFSASKNGEKAPPPGEITCPPGWVWDDDAWIYDINRAVDEKGKDANLQNPLLES